MRNEGAKGTGPDAVAPGPGGLADRPSARRYCAWNVPPAILIHCDLRFTYQPITSQLAAPPVYDCSELNVNVQS